MTKQNYEITNLARRPITFRGNSGINFHLAPGEEKRSIRAVEIVGNPVTEALAKRRVLSIPGYNETTTPPAAKATSAANQKPAASKKTASRKKSAPKAGTQENDIERTD